MGNSPWTASRASGFLIVGLKDQQGSIRINIGMLFDVFFFGFPIIFALCLGAHAVREEDARFWRPAFSFFAYCAFYLAGGRDVILYILCGFMIGGSWLSVGGFCPGIVWTLQALQSSLGI
jgi:hypothetical protein